MFKAFVSHDCYEFSLLIFAQSGKSKIYSVFYLLRACFYFHFGPQHVFIYFNCCSCATEDTHIFPIGARNVTSFNHDVFGENNDNIARIFLVQRIKL